MSKPITPDSLRALVEDFVAHYAESTGDPHIWRKPLLATARVDSRFEILPKIAADDHAMPQDLLPTAKSVLVFFIPFIKELAAENSGGEIPCRNWGLAYESTNRLLKSLCDRIEAHLKEHGHKAVSTPPTHNFDHVKLMSRWSHKHLGYLSGLGRFGVNAQLITPSGCGGRLGSMVTDADLGDSPLVTEKELCLYKNGYKCLVCVDRCPVGAVHADSGITRKDCWARLNYNRQHTEELKGLADTTHVCGKCQVLVPCTLKAPKGGEKLSD